MRSWVQWVIAVLIAVFVAVGLVALLVFLFHVKGKTAGP